MAEEKGLVKRADLMRYSVQDSTLGQDQEKKKPEIKIMFLILLNLQGKGTLLVEGLPSAYHQRFTHINFFSLFLILEK